MWCWKLYDNSVISLSTRSVTQRIHANMEMKLTSLSSQMSQHISRESMVGMNISKHKTLKWVGKDCLMTTQEQVKQISTMDVVIMTVLLIMQITICLMLTTITASLQVQVREYILLMRTMLHRCPLKQLFTIYIFTTQLWKHSIWWPWQSSHSSHPHTSITSQEVSLRSQLMH